MLKTAPGPVDVQDVQFKLHCKLKIFRNERIDSFSTKCSDVATASNYGLIFVGALQSIHVIRCDDLEQCSVKDGEKGDYFRRVVDVNGRVTHLSVNCDGSILAAVTESNKCPVAHFYDVKSFISSQVSVINSIQLSARPGTTVSEIGWNPTNPEVFTACKSDGSLGVYTVGKVVNINELPPEAAVTCFCWSPKGKQIAVGSRKKIIQHKPDLTAARVIDLSPFKGESVIVSLQWISSFQFIAVVTSEDSEATNNVLVIDAPKTGDISYTNYFDICYSNSPLRPTQFYMIYVSQWNMLMMASSNSMEVGVLRMDEDSTWKQLTLMDSARAELPLSDDRSDTLPIGFALDTSATQALPWGEGSIPPAPRMFILSHYGVLCCFHVVNLKQNIPSICNSPQKLDGVVSSLFTKGHTQVVSGIKNIDTTVEQKQVPQTVQNEVTQLVSSKEAPKVPEARISAPVMMPPSISQQNTFSFVGGKHSSSTQEQKFSFANIQPVVPTQSQNSTGLPKMNVLPFETQLKSPSISYEIPKILDRPVISIPQVPKPQAIFAQKVEVEPTILPEATMEDNTNIDDKELGDLLARMIKEECIAIESELKALLHQARLLSLDVGTDVEKDMLSEFATELQEFLSEVVNNNTIQKSDVHVMKQNLIQTWAWLEEARSRHSASKNSTIAAILRTQPLDSAAEKKLLEIKHYVYYFESQLKQAHCALDEQWENFQDYCRKTCRTQYPTMDTVYRSMKTFNDILQKLTGKLKDISARITAHNQLKIKTSHLVDIDNLKKVEDGLKNLSIGPQDVFRMLYERILTRNRLMSSNKTSKLRNYFKQTTVKHVPSFKATIPIPTPQLQTTNQMGFLQKSQTASQIGLLQKSPSANSVQADKAFQTRPSAPNLLFQSDKSKESPQISSLSKSHSFASAFVPTSSSTILFDNTSTAFKAIPSSGSCSFGKSFPATNASVITPVTTASIFSNVPTKSLMNKNVAAPQIQVTSGPANFSSKNVLFTSDQSQPLKFDYHKLDTTDPSVIIVDPLNLQSKSTPKTFSFKLPSDEVSITSKTPVSQATKLSFGISKDILSMQPAASVAPSSTVTVGRTCSTSFTTPSNTVTANLSFGALDITAKKETEKLQVKEVSVSTSSVSSTNLTATQNFGEQFKTQLSSASVKPQSTDSILFKSALQLKDNESLFNPMKTPAEITADRTQKPEQALNAKTLQDLFIGSSITISPVSNVATAGTTSEIDPKPISQTTATIGASAGGDEAKVTTTKSIFGTSSAFQSSLFASAGSNKSLFGTTNNSTSVTKTMTTTTPVTVAESITSMTSATSLVTQSATSNASQASIFENLGTNIIKTADSIAKTTPNQNLFSNNSSIATATSAAVTSSQDTTKGAAIQPIITQSSIFGNLNQTAIKIPDASVSNTSNQNAFTSTTAASSISQGSIFGGVTSSSGNIFGGEASISATAQKSIFGNSGNATSTATSASLIFGGSAVSTTPSIFSPSPTSSTSPSIFGTSSTSPPIGSSAAQTTSSLFGSTASTATAPFSSSATISTTPSIFGSALSTTQSAFGSTVSTSGVFATTTSSTSGVFATATSPTSTIFGAAPSSESSTTSSIFRTAVPSTSSIFGAASSTVSSSAAPGVFGTTVPSSSSIFGSAHATVPNAHFASSAVSTAPAPFGSPSVSTANVQFGSSASAVFGNTPATSAPFGSAVTSSAASPFGTGKSIFGNSSTAFAPTGSIFGAPNSNSTTVTETNTFGAQQSGFNSFGDATTTPNFPSSSPFGTGSIFGTAASSPTNASVSSGAAVGTSAFANLTPQFGTSSSGSLFVNPAAIANNTSFGFGGLNVAPTTATNQFGTNSNPFAKASSIFGTPSTQSSSVFGGSVFGSTTQNTSQNTFGSPPAFGSTPAFAQQSVFGQNTFVSSQPGPFSGGNSTVSQTGFGSPPAFQKPGGFGSSPVFGSPPAFGSAPSFGGAPAFGSSPTFGSPGKAFGNSPMSANFQSTTQESSTFANLANQNTVGFGSLAQQAQNSSGSAFSGNTSFSSWR